MRLNVSRAESVSACVGKCLGPVISLLLFVFIEGWQSIFICWRMSFLHVPRASCVPAFVIRIGGCAWFSKCGPVSRAEHECACLSAFGDSVMTPPHVLARIES